MPGPEGSFLWTCFYGLGYAETYGRGWWWGGHLQTPGPVGQGTVVTLNLLAFVCFKTTKSLNVIWRQFFVCEYL